MFGAPMSAWYFAASQVLWDLMFWIATGSFAVACIGAVVCMWIASRPPDHRDR